jgi:anti-anti-sigma factor
MDLHGEINAFAEDPLNAAYAEAESSNPRAILLNFGDVEYINSTGIALIVGLLSRARRYSISRAWPSSWACSQTKRAPWLTCPHLKIRGL